MFLNKKRLKSAVLYLSLLMILVIIFFFAGEGLVSMVYYVTCSPKFDILEKNDYPLQPDGVIKIAVFGGSAAFGYNSVSSFSDVMNSEFKKKCCGTKIYLKNYAANGYQFYHQQAEALKQIIDKYDIILIFAGNNEVGQYSQRLGIIPSQGGNHNKPLPKTGFERDLISRLERKSHLYAVFFRAKNKMLRVLSELSSSLGKVSVSKKYKSYIPQRGLRPFEIEQMVSHYEEALREIASLAQAHGTVIVISSIPTHELYPPAMSAHRPDLNDEEKDDFGKYYQRGLKFYENNDWKKAVEEFLAVYAIDNQKAVLNYQIGRCFLKLGNMAKGRDYLRQAIANDKYPIRPLPVLAQVSESKAQQSSNVTYIDTVEAFHGLLDKGMDYSDLFNDLQHPSFKGHIVIAHNFLCALFKLEMFQKTQCQKECLEFSPANIEAMLSNYQKELNISQEGYINNTFMIARWHMNVSQTIPNPEFYLEKAKEYFDAYYEMSQKTTDDRALRSFFLAIIEARRKKANKAVQLANEAVALSPQLIEDVLLGNVTKLPAQDHWIFAFEDNGITYSIEKKVFRPVDEKPLI